MSGHSERSCVRVCFYQRGGFCFRRSLFPPDPERCPSFIALTGSDGTLILRKAQVRCFVCRRWFVPPPDAINRQGRYVCSPECEKEWVGE